MQDLIKEIQSCLSRFQSLVLQLGEAQHETDPKNLRLLVQQCNVLVQQLYQTEDRLTQLASNLGKLADQCEDLEPPEPEDPMWQVDPWETYIPSTAYLYKLDFDDFDD